MNSVTNLRNLAERVNSGTNLGDLAERANSRSNLKDLTKRANSGTNLEDLAERANLRPNYGFLFFFFYNAFNAITHLMRWAISRRSIALPREAETTSLDPISSLRLGCDLTSLIRLLSFLPQVILPSPFRSVFLEQVGMTSSDSSSSVRVVPSSGSGGTSLGEPEASSSGASSGPPSPVDARVLRDLEVMKVGHDLDTAVTEGSLAAIRERYSIPVEYGLHVPQLGQRPYSSDAPGVCISVDALEAGLRFPLNPTIEECIRWWRISPSQVAPNSWSYLVFLGECQGAEIIPTRNLFMACFRLCKSQGGYYLTARVGFKVRGAPSNNKGWKARYLIVSGPNWGFRLDWSTHPIGNVPPYLSEESILVDRLKGILSSCAIKEIIEIWLVGAGLSPASRGITLFALFQLFGLFF
ncbi:hypothetical protein BHE74_00057155 [Ensete ventricosum]|nr:hypothetical protein BHE74_00057155 [Ensete ventricosum]